MDKLLETLSEILGVPLHLDGDAQLSLSFTDGLIVSIGFAESVSAEAESEPAVVMICDLAPDRPDDAMLRRAMGWNFGRLGVWGAALAADETAGGLALCARLPLALLPPDRFVRYLDAFVGAAYHARSALTRQKAPSGGLAAADDADDGAAPSDAAPRAFLRA